MRVTILFVVACIFALFLYFYYESWVEPLPPKVLIAIVCIDRDADLAPKLYKALIQNGALSILVVTRETDHKMKNFWQDKALVKTVPHYSIQERHNIQRIAEKRQIALDHAKTHQFDAVWFVDSDILPTQGVLSELLKTSRDICLAPYRVQWGSIHAVWFDDSDIIPIQGISKTSRWELFPCVGIYSSTYPFVKIHVIGFEDFSEKRKPCITAGFGCTLVRSTAFHQKIECGQIKGVEGEDIGFFLNCHKNGLTCEYLTRWEQPHYYDREIS